MDRPMPRGVRDFLDDVERRHTQPKQRPTFGETFWWVAGWAAAFMAVVLVLAFIAAVSPFNH